MGDLKILKYDEDIPAGYILPTLDQVRKQIEIEAVKTAYCSALATAVGSKPVRLKNGLIFNGNKGLKIEPSYLGGLEHKGVIPIAEQGEELKLSDEDRLIALAYAAAHDDVQEVEELVEGRKDLLTKRMPFADMGTILHVCTLWNSIKTLKKVVEEYHDSVNVHILNDAGKTALHNLADNWERASKNYESCKTAASLLLGLRNVNENNLLSYASDGYTVLLNALAYGQKEACRALLDAAKELMQGDPTWLTLMTHIGTALHLAVLGGYADIVDGILAYPGAQALHLTSLPDHSGNTPLHLAAAMPNADLTICSSLLSDSYTRDPDSATSSLVQLINNRGETPLHIAAALGHAELCGMLVECGATSQLSVRDKQGRDALTNALHSQRKEVVETLLDACLQSESKSDQLRDAKSSLINARLQGGLTPLHVAVSISSQSYVAHLIRAGASIDYRSDDGNTPLHLAAQQFDSAPKILKSILLAAKDKELPDHIRRKEWINRRDVSGQTALHILVKKLTTLCDQTYSSEASGHSDQIDFHESLKTEKVLRLLLEGGAWVDAQDCNGATFLHEAVQSKNMKNVVKFLLSPDLVTQNNLPIINDRDDWVAMCDFSGETALHRATRAGHLYFVDLLLEATKSPDNLLLVRDMDNMTAFDRAALHVKDDNMIQKMMETSSDDMTKSFLLWHLKDHDMGVYQHYLKKYNKGKHNLPQLLHAAVENKDMDIATELINKGADTTSLSRDDRHWLAQNFRKKASDLPTSVDTLGRRGLVQGVASLLLNPYTQTPITIGVFGSWGTGKSSFMLQVEEAMLHMAVKEIYKEIPDTPSHDRKLYVHNLGGKLLRRKVVKALKQCMKPQSTSNSQQPDIENQNPLDDEHDIINSFTMEEQSKYGQLFKDLALTDRSTLVSSNKRTRTEKRIEINDETLEDSYLLGYAPAILTLHYNAWQYDNKTEASAGLAVEISQQLERFMTPHQWLRMCWEYSWNTRPREIFVHLLLPTFIALVVIIVVLIFWKLVPIGTKYKSISLPMGIVVVMWVYIKASVQVIQPVTQAMLDATKSPDHRSMLGYQHQVISDIKFLKGQLCQRAHIGWLILSFFCKIFIANKYFMEDTWIRRQHPSLKNFRIVVFVDDLDRCEESTILELLRAISLILGSCEINAVIGVDKGMLERAIIKEFLKDSSDNVYATSIKNIEKMMASKDSGFKHAEMCEIAENYLQKIIQIPIHLANPSKNNIDYFLQAQVGQTPSGILGKSRKGNAEEDETKSEHKDEKENQGYLQDKDNTKDDAQDRAVSRLMLANYTPMEKDMLRRLCKLATQNQKAPREWKRFLNYHRLAWTVASQDHELRGENFKGWQRKLILWIFICWNWRDQMDVIFKNWYRLRMKGSRQKRIENMRGMQNTSNSLTLCDLIDTYREERGWNDKGDANQNTEIEGLGEIDKESWKILRNVVKEEYDIPICFVDKFQQFRFFCMHNYLEVDEGTFDKDKEMTEVDEDTFDNNEVSMQCRKDMLRAMNHHKILEELKRAECRKTKREEGGKEKQTASTARL